MTARTSAAWCVGAAAALAVFAAVPAKAADTRTGNGLIEGCKAFASGDAGKVARDPTAPLCAGLVLGVAFADPMICYPTQSTPQQGVRVVAKFLEEHPERLHEPGEVLVRDALRRTWPCKATK